MAQALFYSSNAVAMTLAAGIASGDTTCNLSSTSGLPASFPFKLLIGWQTAQQEVVHCTALSGVVATISRGQDGTTAQAHSIGASVIHGVSAREFNDLESHVGASSAVHGITGSVVGTTDAQTLTNKTLDATSTVSGAPIVGTTLAQTLTNKTLTAPITQPASTAGIGLTVRGLASQNAALQSWQDSTTAPLAQVLSSGVYTSVQGVQIGAASFSGVGWNGISNPTGATTLPSLVVKRIASQSADLQRWTDENNVLLAKVDNAGNLTATNVTSAWTAYTPTFTNCTSPAGTFRYLLMGKTLFLRANFSGGTATAAASISFTLPAGNTGQANGNQLVPGTVANAFSQFIVNTGLTTVGSTASLSAGQALSGITLSGTVEVA